MDGEQYWVTGESMQNIADKIIALASAPKEQRKQCPSFRDYTKKWMRLYCEPKVKPTTLAGYNAYCKNHLYPAFGDRPLNEISVNDVQAFLNERSSYAAKTLKEMKVFLSMVLDAALEDGWITKNPAASKRLIIPSHKVTERQALTSSTA